MVFLVLSLFSWGFWLIFLSVYILVREIGVEIRYVRYYGVWLSVRSSCRVYFVEFFYDYVGEVFM